MQQLTRTVHTKLGMFALVGLLGTSYLGASYAGFTPFSDGYRVTVSLPEAGGLFVNSEVTYRGVQVGEVTDLEATADGVEVTVEIEPDAPDIPADAAVPVRNRSAIGEQYLDLAGSDSDDLLADGDHLSAGTEALPQDLAEVLRTGRDFVASVPSDALDTVIDEGYELPDEATSFLELSPKERAAAGVRDLPQSLAEALDAMEGSELVREALGDHIFEWFLRNKRAEWADYKAQVTPFELARYLPAW